MQKIIIGLVVIVLIGIGAYFVFDNREEVVVIDDQDTEVSQQDETDETPDENDEEETERVIGQSVDGRDITAYHFGTGDTEVLFVGGIHGGYSWNTALVAYELMDYLEANPSVIPENVQVTVVPVLNPDGLATVTGTTGRFEPSDVAENTVPGRFNANEVDLNRNFDCDWQETGTWQSRTVDAGAAPFSEPESQAIRVYIEAADPEAVVVWYSAAGGVFTSSCHTGVLPETRTLTNLYADASGYKAYEEFDFYEITGDMVNWLAKMNIPAISVLLSNHEEVEWTQNRAGVGAILEHYAD